MIEKEKLMNIFSLIFSLVFLVCAGLAALIGILYGRKYKWQLSFTRIISVFVAALLAAVIAAIISNLTVSAVMSSLENSGALGELGEILEELPNGNKTLSALVSMIAAPIIFIPLFLILRILVNIISKLVLKSILSLADKKQSSARQKERKYVERKHFSKKNEYLVVRHANYLGAALGAVCSVLVLCTCLIPLTGMLDLVDGVIPIVLNISGEEEEETEQTEEAVPTALLTVVRIADGAANNAGTLTVKLAGGKFFYGIMTTSSIDGEMANLNKESKLFATLTGAAVEMLDTDADPTRAADAIRKVSPAFDKSVATRILITEFCSAAGEDWNAGREFHGIKRPYINKQFKSLTNAMIQVFSTSDKENIKSDVKALTEAMAIITEDELMVNIMNDPMVILSDEDTNSKLLRVFLEDERHMPLVDGIADFGVGMMMDSVKAPATKQERYVDFIREFTAVEGTEQEELAAAYGRVFENYAIRDYELLSEHAASAALAGSNMTAWVINNVVADQDEFAAKTELVSKEMVVDGVAVVSDKEHEADALAHAFAVIYNITVDISGDAFSAKKMLATMGPALDSFANTETVGAEKTGLMLTAILQSELVHDQIGFTVLEATDTAISIRGNSATTGYASVMQSLSGVIEMLESASDKSKNTKEAVDRMLENLTPEAATVMQTMATPGVMKNYGVPERSAAASAEMISNTFGNLKDVPSDQYANESGAVADMMNVMMSITENTNSATPTFGGPDSATQISEEEYVNNIMDSTAMSKTVVETVYGEGDEPKTDPLDSQKNLSDTEKANLVTSLNNRWQTSEKDEDTKKEIISIAAMMNLSVKITDDAVTLAE